MQRSLFLPGILCCLVITATAQQKPVDKETVDHWIYLREAVLSADGKYCAYTTGSNIPADTVHLQATDGSWSVKFHGTIRPCCFTANSSRFIFPDNQKLVMIDLKTRKIDSIPEANSFLLPEQGNGQWMAYSRFGAGKLVLRDLFTGKEKNYEEVSRHFFDSQGKTVVLIRKDDILWIDPTTQKEYRLPVQGTVAGLAFDKSGQQLALISKDDKGCHLLYAKWGQTSLRPVAEDDSPGLKKGFLIREGDLSFTPDGTSLFFFLGKEKQVLEPGSDVITDKVNVWSYRDKEVQPKQLATSNEEYNRLYAASLHLASGKIIQLEDETRMLEPSGKGNKTVVVSNRPISQDELYWNGETRSVSLVWLESGKETKLYEGNDPALWSFSPFSLSPAEDKLIWFDAVTQQYICYQLNTGVRRVITEGIRDSLSCYLWRGQPAKGIHWRYAAGPVSWLNNETALVQARYDLWQVDLSGKSMPLNLTGGYGNANKVRFRLQDGDGFEESHTIPQFGKGRLLLNAFSEATKQNGFWCVTPGKAGSQEKLVMDDHAWYFQTRIADNSGHIAGPDKFKPIRAKNAEMYLVRRTSSSEEPNIFATRDFRNFTPVSHVSNGTNAGYQGTNTRLISYALPDGSICDGVLHTPVNFDSTRKYPLIFTYYERHSEIKNAFRFPEVSRAPLNIPWYLSRGYLVFEPDFYFTTGKTSESVLQSIDGAVRQLARIPFVDTARMGVQGHSHGGYETNIIATGCHYFKAACEGSGYSNVISEYGSLRPGGFNNQRASDIDQRNLAVFPWEKPEVFVLNSPVFHIGKMTTPLLIMHNKKDGAVNFSHAIEMYMGMRRIGKPVWMLEYDEEGHSVEDSMNKMDYTIRMQQFFDHYLKGAPPPVWMTKGISAKEKGWVSGLAPDMNLAGQSDKLKENNTP